MTMTEHVCNHAEWITRDQCGPWTPTWIAVYITASLMVFSAYMLIPWILMHAQRQDRSDRPVHPLGPGERLMVRVSGGLFILSCGVGHLEGILAFVWPHYPTFAVWHLATGVVSWWAALLFARVRGRVLLGV